MKKLDFILVAGCVICFGCSVKDKTKIDSSLTELHSNYQPDIGKSISSFTELSTLLDVWNLFNFTDHVNKLNTNVTLKSKAVKQFKFHDLIYTDWEDSLGKVYKSIEIRFKSDTTSLMYIKMNEISSDFDIYFSESNTEMILINKVDESVLIFSQEFPFSDQYSQMSSIALVDLDLIRVKKIIHTARGGNYEEKLFGYITTPEYEGWCLKYEKPHNYSKHILFEKDFTINEIYNLFESQKEFVKDTLIYTLEEGFCGKPLWHDPRSIIRTIDTSSSEIIFF